MPRSGIAPIFCAAIVSSSSFAFPEAAMAQGKTGGPIVFAEKAEPRSFNPVTALDSISRNILQLTMADLVHIDRQTLLTQPALAERWEVSSDRRRYTVHLRRGVLFSDG